MEAWGTAAMQKFEYRAPRYPVDLPVRLRQDDRTLHARCREISREGMRLELREPLPEDFCGTVSLNCRHVSLELRVRVTHTGILQDGLRFIFESEKQRRAVAQLVAILAASEPGPVQVI